MEVYIELDSFQSYTLHEPMAELKLGQKLLDLPQDLIEKANKLDKEYWELQGTMRAIFNNSNPS